MLKDGKKQEHFLGKWEVVLSFDNDNIIKKAFEKVAQDVLLKTFHNIGVVRILYCQCNAQPTQPSCSVTNSLIRLRLPASVW